MLALKESEMMGPRKFDLLALKDSSGQQEKKESSLSIKQTEKRESSLSFKQTDRKANEYDNELYNNVPSSPHHTPRKYEPIWMKHPTVYLLKTSMFPLTRVPSGLNPSHTSASCPSYDCMVKYLGIRNPTFHLCKL
ncbi:hypothetical protein Pcinc_040995 [Petrolisthes cinctipes]|uniref:Uncharacterized protein n=1 Tax=Petrolisthes cinctipes TaxID=88211 RepID=A0AAE1EHG6_PETCI|nr:hypothetical protein Pcinc_040995 [Petrolisthes cinctipes]